MDQIEAAMRAFLRITPKQSAQIGLPRIIANICECTQLTFSSLTVHDDPHFAPLSFTSVYTIAPLCKGAAAMICRLLPDNTKPAIQIERELEGLVGGWLLESQPRQQDYSQAPSPHLQPIAQP